jgi:hypothetical protein
MWVIKAAQILGTRPWQTPLTIVSCHFMIARENGVGARTERFTLAYVDYISNTLLFEGAYEFICSNNPVANQNRLLFQVSFGF